MLASGIMSADESKFAKCFCRTCSGHIEFETAAFDPASPPVIVCPHCGAETSLFIPTKPDRPPIIVAPPEPPSLACLPAITDEGLRALLVKSSDGQCDYAVDLIDYTCTCPDFLKVHAQAPRAAWVGCVNTFAVR